MVNCYPRKYLYCRVFLFATILACWSFIAHATDTDSLQRPQTVIADLPAMNLAETRSFPEIDRQLATQIIPATATGLFTEAYVQSMYTDDSTTNSYREQAKAEFLKMDKGNRYTSSLTPDDLNELPIGLFRKVNNTVVKIAISNAIFHPTYAELTVFAKVEIPQEPKEIFFGVKGLKLSYNGGIIGDAKLVLLGNVPIRINGGTAVVKLKGGMNMETGQGLDLTYVTMDCNGFKELGVAAEIKFPRSMLVPLKPDGERNEDTTAFVKGDFNTVVSDWNDILVSIDLPDFEITPLKGVGFHIGKAVYDGSDVRNSPDIVYPKGYEDRYMPADNPELWRGVYVKTLEVILPKQFMRRQQSGKRVSFGGNNMIVDNNGLTGSFFGNNILPDGTAAGWRFSVDRFNIDLEANHLVGAGFQGMVGLPVAEAPLGYTAIVTADNEYILKLNTIDTMRFNVWKARAELEPNSWVQMKLAGGRFEPEAMLHGRLIIAASTKQDDKGKPVAVFKGIIFKDLHLQTKPPYLTTSYFGYKEENTVSNFPVSFTEIALKAMNGEASLTFGIRINLMEQNFAGNTKIIIVGKFDEKEGIQTWKFDKLKLEEIHINAKVSKALTIAGTLKIYEDDAVYGDAISGEVKANFMEDKVKVEARAMFGCKDFRYWYVDAKASFKPGIPILPPVNLTGFGGGAYYRMKKAGFDVLASPSPTGVNYVPDEKTGLGIKAAVLLNISQDQVVNCEVTYEVAFNRSGGINFIGFYGYASILNVLPNLEGDINGYLGKQFSKLAAEEEKLAAQMGDAGEKLMAMKVSNPSLAAEKMVGDDYKAGESGVSAYVGIQYDFTTSTLHANFDLYVNVAGGIMTGNASGNRAGWAVIHVSPDEWYMHMGTPTNRLGIKLAVAGISVKTGSYLMVGDKIPGSPPPPQEVADILGMDLNELDYMRDLNALGDGRGFAFGSSLTVETGDITFLILYANFKAGLGFDIMLKDYGDAHCAGSSEPIGIDGWYANGQAYAYLQGELGVKVNLRFIKARITILSGSAAMLMQAKLPNPTWMKGYMAVRFKVLGGLVSGNMRMKVSIGDECQIVTGSNSPVDVKIISDVTPAKNATDIDVFTAPQAAFNMKIGQSFDVEDDNGTKTYRARLAAFTVTDAGQPLAGKLVWNSNNDAVSFYSKEVLPPKKTLEATVKVTFEELVNGKWQTVFMDGQQSEETETRSFTTSTAPDYIPLTNIAYSYPVVGQRNFYREEYSKGMINLSMGQAYLFDNRWRYEIRFTDANGAITKADMQYDSISQILSYNMPALNASAQYQFDVIAVPPGATGTDTVVAYQRTDAGDDGSYTVANNQAKSVSRGDVMKSLLNYGLRTSKFRTFSDKMNTLHRVDALAANVITDVVRLIADVGEYEGFEVAELTGNGYSGYNPLVNVEAVMDDAYYNDDINPLLYRGYPVDQDILITNRNPDELGLVPSKAFVIMPSYLAEASAGDVKGWVKTRLPYQYDLPLIYKLDFLDLQYKAVNKYLDSPERQRFEYLINGHFPYIRYGTYKVRYQYVLPDGTRTSNAVFDYHNPQKTRGY
jgi:hypothetical protein